MFSRLIIIPEKSASFILGMPADWNVVLLAVAIDPPIFWQMKLLFDAGAVWEHMHSIVWLQAALSTIVFMELHMSRPRISPLNSTVVFGYVS